LLLEDVNDPFKISEFTVSSVSFLVEESFFGGEVVLGINDILVRLSGELPSISFSDEGDFEVDGEFLEVSVSLFGVNMESSNFSFRFDLILGSIKSGFDFVSFEESGTFFKMFLESVEHSVNFIVHGTNKVRGVDGGFEFSGVEFISVGVIVTRFFSSGVGVIKIFKVSFISVSIWDFNFTSLEEFFHGVDLEEVLVLREFVGESTFFLSEDWSFTGSLSSGEFSSKDGNGVKGVLVLFELLDEKLVGLTSGNIKLDKFSSNGGESVIDPFEMVVGVLDFSFNPFSVSGGIFSNFSVSVGNSGEIGDGLSTFDLLLSPTSFMFFLFLIDRILKFEKELFNGVNSIRSHSIGSHHIGNFSIETDFLASSVG